MAEPQEYTPPATQEDLNRIIAERVARERTKYADYEDLKGKAAKYAELEESQKSELQKQSERAAAAEKRLAELEQQQQLAGWRADVAKAKGVPAEVLRGSSKEELEAHADELKPLLEAQKRQAARVPNPGSTPNQNTDRQEDRAFAHSLLSGE